MKLLKQIEELVSELRYITFDQKKVKNFCESITWNYLNPGLLDLGRGKFQLEDNLTILFYFNAMNFCFFPPNGKRQWEINIGGKLYNGSKALWKALSNWALKNPEFLNVAKTKNMSFQVFKKMLREDVGNLALLKLRYDYLIDTAKVIDKNFDSAYLLVKRSNHSAKEILFHLVDKFLSYQDISDYKGRKLPFYKRAQLLVKMISDALEAHRKSKLNDIGILTAMADYKVPQVLRFLEIIRYSDSLSELVDSQVILEKDSTKEVEIRIATVWGVELIKRSLKNRLPDLNAADIDTLLWVESQGNKERYKPYHRTFTTAY